MGRKIWLVEPVIGYYWYNCKYEKLLWSEGKLTEKFQVLNFGVGIPWKGATVIPEINWVNKGMRLKEGLGIISLGMRVPVAKPPKK